jgi:hypothetical protein
LDELMSELGAESEFDADGFDVPSDAFFTARVLDALPEPLRMSGASPVMRAITLLGFHVAAAIVGVLVYRWASPRLLDVAASRAEEATSGWASGLALAPLGDPAGSTSGAAATVVGVVLVVGLVAFWATRSHTRAT